MATAFSPDGTRLLSLRNSYRVKPAAQVDGNLQEWDIPVRPTPDPHPRERIGVWNADDSRRLWFDQAHRNDLPTGQ